MNEKLTLEILMKYSKVKIRYGEHDFIISGIDLLDNNLAIRNEKENLWTDISISDCKLILRPLSSLTEEEKKEIDMIQRKFSLRALADDNDETYRKHFQRITDKYREWNIDVETPSLQERGLCVYE